MGRLRNAGGSSFTSSRSGMGGPPPAHLQPSASLLKRLRTGKHHTVIISGAALWDWSGPEMRVASCQWLCCVWWQMRSWHSLHSVCAANNSGEHIV